MHVIQLEKENNYCLLICCITVNIIFVSNTLYVNEVRLCGTECETVVGKKEK